MYTYKHSIIRVDKTADFFYNAKNTLNDQLYLVMSDAAKQQGKLISETNEISEDGLVFVRTVTWDSKESFTNFFSQWKAEKPNYTTELESYCQQNGHIRLFEVLS